MALPSPNVCELIRAHFILLGSPSWKEEERDRLLKLLAEHGLKWGDLPEVLLATANLGATTPPGLLLRHHFGWAICQRSLPMRAPRNRQRSCNLSDGWLSALACLVRKTPTRPRTHENSWTRSWPGTG
jgi:hypothetical protein